MKISSKRFKFLITFLLAFVIFIPFLVFADSLLDGFRSLKYSGSVSIPMFWNTTNDPTNIATSTTGVCIDNQSGNDYFIPTRTISEWTDYFNNPPDNLYPTSCVGDGICRTCPTNRVCGPTRRLMGCEDCNSAPQDCGTCSLLNCPTTFTDPRDGTVYPIFGFDNKCWFAKNLAYLPNVTGSGVGSTGIALNYVYGYEGTSVAAAKATANYSTYGVLYNYTSAASACPSGSHLSTDSDFNDLQSYFSLCTVSDTISRLKVSSSNNPAWDGSSVDFKALPAGERLASAAFGQMSSQTYFWTSLNGSYANSFSLVTAGTSLSLAAVDKSYGYSVRCVLDINYLTLNYSASSGGHITGSTLQKVFYGGSGTAVTAVPDTKYTFINWSDGSTANPRTDTNVTTNQNLTANFATTECGVCGLKLDGTDCPNTCTGGGGGANLTNCAKTANCSHPIGCHACSQGATCCDSSAPALCGDAYYLGNSNGWHCSS